MPTKAETIMAELIAAGFTTGSLADRERKRLLAKVALTEPQNLSLADLYRLGNERPRLN